MTPPREPLREENERLRAELVEVYRKLSVLHSEIEQAPVVYSSWESTGSGGTITDTWKTDWHDVSLAKFKARLVRIEEIGK